MEFSGIATNDVELGLFRDTRNLGGEADAKTVT
jgi:hypothetical protein